ncbi:hypothetical protein D0Y65_042616 [Glycine soja]|nr:hypothetical protein D0Y65_042616 [Glycine soja]
MEVAVRSGVRLCKGFVRILTFEINALPNDLVNMSIQPISNNIDGLHLDDDEHGDAQENAMEDVNQNESNVRESSDFMDGEHIRGPEFDDAT